MHFAAISGFHPAEQKARSAAPGKNELALRILLRFDKK
jgi:hypothetical protein